MNENISEWKQGRKGEKESRKGGKNIMIGGHACKDE